MTQEFNIGDKVKVVNTSMNFNYYSKWANEQGLIKFLVGEELIADSVGIVAAKAPHSVGGECARLYGNIYGIEISGKQFIVGGPCLELIKEKPLAISHFISSMPATSRAGVFQEANKYTVFAYDAGYYAETEERLREIMEALLVLYKED